MAQISFNFYGVSVTVGDISSTFPVLLASLAEDFDYFVAPADAEPFLNIKVIGSEWTQGSDKKLLTLKTSRFRVYGWGIERICDYLDAHHVVSQNYKNHRSFQVYGLEESRLHEIIYLLILSAVGEELEARGYYRLHALAFRDSRKVCIALLASGMGKSTVANLLLKREDVRIYSDEIALIYKGQLLPFPLRQALTPESVKRLDLQTEHARPFQRKEYKLKWLFPITKEKIANPARPDVFLYGRKNRSQKWNSKLDLKSYLMLFIDIILGIGLPQMSEHMLRPSNFFRLCHIAIKRIGFAFWILKTCPVKNYMMFPTPEENLKFLTDI